LEIRGLDANHEPPATLVTMELIYFVQLARIATRERIEPLALTSPQPPQPDRQYAEYFGARVQPGAAITLTFSAQDAARSFLTANEGMWRFFEPTLNQRLFELDARAAVSEKVRAALLEMLPGGNASLNAVSSKLGFSPRTLHRRLSEEGVSFQIVLSRTREELAKHYLGHSAMSGAEISFLLGYEDPNSFFRAFQQWTGQTPERARELLRQ
jgi:AraC-like DNA-binding protein